MSTLKRHTVETQVDFMAHTSSRLERWKFEMDDSTVIGNEEDYEQIRTIDVCSVRTDDLVPVIRVRVNANSNGAYWTIGWSSDDKKTQNGITMFEQLHANWAAEIKVITGLDLSAPAAAEATL